MYVAAANSTPSTHIPIENFEPQVYPAIINELIVSIKQNAVFILQLGCTYIPPKENKSAMYITLSFRFLIFF